MLIIVSSKPVETKLVIKIEACDYFTDSHQNPIEVEQIIFKPTFFFQKSFIWKLENPGPRKRLQSNTEEKFYSEETFK